MLRFSCEKALLQSAVNTVSRAVAAKSSIPALEGILVEGSDRLTMSGYNMQTGIRTAFEAEVHEEGRIVLNARLFGEIIRKLPDDLVVFAADEKYMVRLTCGDASFEINEQGLTMVSVDGFRLALRREPLERIDGGAFRFVAPGSALNEVEKICEDSDNLMTIIQGKRHLMFETGSTQLICRRLEGEFLDYRNAIPRNNPISILVDTKAMLNSLDRVSVVISEKLKSPVHCIFDDGRVYLSAKTGNGEAKDICPVEGDGQGLEIGFNNRFFMDALRYAPAEKVKMELNTGISPCIMTPVEGEENFLYMVLPVRLKA